MLRFHYMSFLKGSLTCYMQYYFTFFTCYTSCRKINISVLFPQAMFWLLWCIDLSNCFNTVWFRKWKLTSYDCSIYKTYYICRQYWYYFTYLASIRIKYLFKSIIRTRSNWLWYLIYGVSFGIVWQSTIFKEKQKKHRRK